MEKKIEKSLLSLLFIFCLVNEGIVLETHGIQIFTEFVKLNNLNDMNRLIKSYWVNFLLTFNPVMPFQYSI